MHEPTPRKRLLVAFAHNLEQIAVSAGYRTDIGTVVTLEPGQLDPEQIKDGLAVFIERQARAPEAAVASVKRLTTIGIVVQRRAFGEAEIRLDDVLDDIERVLDRRATTWPSGFTAPQYLDMEPLRGPASQDWVGAVIRYTSFIPIR